MTVREMKVMRIFRITRGRDLQEIRHQIAIEFVTWTIAKCGVCCMQCMMFMMSELGHDYIKWYVRIMHDVSVS